MKLQLTQKMLREALDYDADAGVFTWRTTGKEAGAIRNSGKRRKPSWRIGIGGRQYARGRLAWFWKKARWPSPEIDHIDRDSLNDRWLNLREATRSQNEANKGPKRDNKLGVRGVCMWHGLYRAQIYRGKKIFIGNFPTLEAAHAAYLQVARKYDGDFLRAERPPLT
jgi:hypothetical protein